MDSFTPYPGVIRWDSLNTHKKRESQGVMLNDVTLPLALGSTQTFGLGSLFEFTARSSRRPHPEFSSSAPRLTALQVRRFPAHMSEEPSPLIIK